MSENIFSIDESICQLNDNFIFNHLPIGIAVKDSMGICRAANTLLANVCGLKTSQAFLGLTESDLSGEIVSLFPTFKWQDQSVLSEQVEKIFIDIFKYPDGKHHLFLTRKKVIFDVKKEPFVLVAMTEFGLDSLKSIFRELSYRQASEGKSFYGSYEVKKGDEVSFQTLSLTKMQLTVLFYLVRGQTCVDIAAKLSRSPRTIEKHVENLKAIFACHTKSQLIEKAIELGFGCLLPAELISTFSHLPI